MSTLQKYYMAEDKVLYTTLIELCKFCHTHHYSILMTKDEQSSKSFKINLTKNIYLELNLLIINSNHTRPHPIIEVTLEPNASHSKGTKKISSFMKSAGRVIGGGIGLVVSIATVGIGWIAGTGITLGAAKIGELPATLVDKVDTFLTDNALEKYNGEIQSIVGLFSGRMIELPKFDPNSHDMAQFCNSYIKKHQKYIGHFSHKKKKLSFSFNALSKEKNSVKFYRSITSDDSEFIMEVKNKIIEGAEITTDEEVAQELYSEYCSSFIGTNYEALINHKIQLDSEETTSVLLAKFRKQLVDG